MKSYAKPVVLANDEVAEGVYAGSGTSSADCWTINVEEQNYDGANRIFEVQCVHSTDVEHISDASEVTLTFSANVTNAFAEAGYPCVVSGKKVTITRTLLANAYKSGDRMTYKVFVQCSDAATTQAVRCTGATISCDKKVNVQGGGSHGE